MTACEQILRGVNIRGERENNSRSSTSQLTFLAVPCLPSGVPMIKEEETASQLVVRPLPSTLVVRNLALNAEGGQTVLVCFTFDPDAALNLVFSASITANFALNQLNSEVGDAKGGDISRFSLSSLSFCSCWIILKKGFDFCFSFGAFKAAFIT